MSFKRVESAEVRVKQHGKQMGSMKLRIHEINQRIKKFSAIAKEVLEVQSRIKSANPITIGLGMLTVYSTICDQFIGTDSYSSSFLKRAGLTRAYNPIAAFVFRVLKDSNIIPRIPWKDGSSSDWIEEFTLPNSKVCFVRDNYDYLEGVYLDDVPSFLIDMSKLIEEQYGSHLLLEASGAPGEWEKRMSLSTIEPIDDPYIPPFDEDKFLGDIHKFFNKGLNRSLIFYGPPGSGKTTMALRIANKIKGRILILNGWALANKATGSVFQIVSLIKPTVILFDDLDKINDLEDLIGDIEHMNRTSGENNEGKIFIATVNDLEEIPEPIRRPGRFDQAIEFSAHKDQGMRKKILLAHAERCGLTLSNKDAVKLAKLSDGLTGAYLREIVLRAMVLGMGEIKEHIDNMKYVYSLNDDDDNDDDDLKKKVSKKRRKTSKLFEKHLRERDV